MQKRKDVEEARELAAIDKASIKVQNNITFSTSIQTCTWTPLNAVPKILLAPSFSPICQHVENINLQSNLLSMLHGMLQTCQKAW